MNFNPKKIKRSEVKIFSFITSYINLIDYVLLLVTILTSILLIIYAPLSVWVSINTVLYLLTFFFILKFNNKRISYLLWKYIYFRLSTEKEIVIEPAEVEYPSDHVIKFNGKFYVGLTFNLDYEFNNDSQSDREIKNKFEKFFYYNESNVLIFNSSNDFKDTYPNLYEKHRFNNQVKTHTFLFEWVSQKSIENFLIELHEYFSRSDYELMLGSEIENLLIDSGIASRYDAKINPRNVQIESKTLFYKNITFKKVELSDEIKDLLSQNSIIYLKKIPQPVAIKKVKNDFSYFKLGLNANQEQVEKYELLIKELENEEEVLFEVGIILIDSELQKRKSKFVHFELNLFKQNQVLENIINLEFETNNYLIGSNIKVIQDFSSSSIVSDETGYLIGFNSENRPIYFDPTYKDSKDRINSNHLIMGMSGSGKSYLMKRYQSIIQDMNKNYLILDAEQEYTSDEYGQYLKFNLMFVLNSHIYFDVAKSTYLSIVYEIWEAISNENVDKLIEYFEEMYDSRSIFTSDLLKELVSYYGIRLNSTFLSLFESIEEPTTLSHYQTINIIFDIKEFLEISKFSSHITVLFDRSIIFALSNFVNLLDERGEHFAIFFDEFHLFLNANNELIIYITQLVKQIRKRNGMLFLSTQNLIDFKGNNQFIIQTIMNNCNYYYFSKMMSTDITEFSNLMKDSYFISPATIKQIERLERGEFLFTIQTKRYEIIKIY